MSVNNDLFSSVSQSIDSLDVTNVVVNVCVSCITSPLNSIVEFSAPKSEINAPWTDILSPIFNFNPFVTSLVHNEVLVSSLYCGAWILFASNICVSTYSLIL